MIKNYLIIFFSFLVSQSLSAQDVTLGLLNYDISQSYQGYTLIYPHNQSSVFLLNNCGEIVHEWEDEADFRPGNTAYLLDDGRLAKTKRNASIAGDSIWAGGGGAIIELRSWDNELLWSYEMNSPEARLHHDFRIMPNGNVLMLAWERKTNAEAIAAGRDSALLNQIILWPDFIQEVNPETDEIVWEWHVWDHLVQDIDSTKANYGIVSEHPEKVDVNWDTSEGASDWMHTNAMDYNPELDQIMISVPTFHEIWVIDHSTTTAQAATDRGGNSNNGGDLLYRIGNPATYDRSDAGDQILFYQHDAHWTNQFIPRSHPAYGNVICFNNRQPGGYSTVEVFESAWNMYTVDYEMFQDSWPPYEFENTITHPDTFALNSSGLSSAQLLPNGNMLICSGRFGYTFELTPENKIVWEYITPRRGTMEVAQGEILEINNNLTFRAFRYPPEYSAFEGRDLEAKGYIELDPVEDWCDRLVSTSTPEQSISMIYPNPTTDRVQIKWDSGKVINIEIFNLSGQRVLSTTGNGGMSYVDVSQLNKGLYIIALDGQSSMRMIKQ